MGNVDISMLGVIFEGAILFVMTAFCFFVWRGAKRQSGQGDQPKSRAAFLTGDQILNLIYDAVTPAIKVNIAATSGAGGLATESKQDTQITVAQAIQAAVETIDDWDESDRAKVNPIVGQAGIAAGAGAVVATVPRVTLASDDPAVAKLTTIDADTSLFATSGGGGYIRQDSTGTIAKETGGNLADCKMALQILDNAAATIGTTDVHRVAIFDNANTQITAFGSPSTVSEYRSPSDFTATYATSTTLTLASLPISISNSAQIVYIRVVRAANTSTVYVNGSGGVTFGVSGATLTIYGAGTPFLNTDVYEVGLNLQNKGYDATNALWKQQEQSPLHARRTDPVALIGSAQDFTASMADLGAEINCGGYNHLRVWLTLDINSSTDCRISVLGKHTSAGSVEAPYEPSKWTLRDSTLSTTGTYREWNTDADGDYILEVELDNCMPYIQLQIQAGTVGGTAGQIDAATYVLGY